MSFMIFSPYPSFRKPGRQQDLRDIMVQGQYGPQCSDGQFEGQYKLEHLYQYGHAKFQLGCDQ